MIQIKANNALIGRIDILESNLATLNSNLTTLNSDFTSLNNFIGTRTLTTSAQTLGGGVNELNAKFANYLLLNDFYNLPYCHVDYTTSTPSATTFAQGSTVIWNNKIYDTHNAYSTSTGKFTCPMAGIYFVAVSYYSSTPTANTARPRIWHTNSSGSAYADGGVQLQGESAVSLSGMFYCHQGDLLYFGPQGGSTNYNITFYTGRYHNSMTICCIRKIV